MNHNRRPPAKLQPLREMAVLGSASSTSVGPDITDKNSQVGGAIASLQKIAESGDDSSNTHQVAPIPPIGSKSFQATVSVIGLKPLRGPQPSQLIEGAPAMVERSTRGFGLSKTLAQVKCAKIPKPLPGTMPFLPGKQVDAKKVEANMSMVVKALEFRSPALTTPFKILPPINSSALGLANTKVDTPKVNVDVSPYHLSMGASYSNEMNQVRPYGTLEDGGSFEDVSDFEDFIPPVSSSCQLFIIETDKDFDVAEHLTALRNWKVVKHFLKYMRISKQSLQRNSLDIINWVAVTSMEVLLPAMSLYQGSEEDQGCDRDCFSPVLKSLQRTLSPFLTDEVKPRSAGTQRCVNAHRIKEATFSAKRLFETIVQKVYTDNEESQDVSCLSPAASLAGDLMANGKLSITTLLERLSFSSSQLICLVYVTLLDTKSSVNNCFKKEFCTELLQQFIHCAVLHLAKNSFGLPGIPDGEFVDADYEGLLKQDDTSSSSDSFDSKEISSSLGTAEKEEAFHAICTFLLSRVGKVLFEAFENHETVSLVVSKGLNSGAKDVFSEMLRFSPDSMASVEDVLDLTLPGETHGPVSFAPRRASITAAWGASFESEEKNPDCCGDEVDQADAPGLSSYSGSPDNKEQRPLTAAPSPWSSSSIPAMWSSPAEELKQCYIGELSKGWSHCDDETLDGPPNEDVNSDGSTESTSTFSMTQQEVMENALSVEQGKITTGEDNHAQTGMRVDNVDLYAVERSHSLSPGINETFLPEKPLEASSLMSENALKDSTCLLSAVGILNTCETGDVCENDANERLKERLEDISESAEDWESSVIPCNDDSVGFPVASRSVESRSLDIPYSDFHRFAFADGSLSETTPSMDNYRDTMNSRVRLASILDTSNQKGKGNVLLSHEKESNVSLKNLQSREDSAVLQAKKRTDGKTKEKVDKKKRSKDKPKKPKKKQVAPVPLQSISADASAHELIGVKPKRSPFRRALNVLARLFCLPCGKKKQGHAQDMTN